jgi:hypothetical protein
MLWVQITIYTALIIGLIMLLKGRRKSKRVLFLKVDAPLKQEHYECLRIATTRGLEGTDFVCLVLDQSITASVLPTVKNEP